MHYMYKPYLWLLQSNVVNMVGNDLISNLSLSKMIQRLKEKNKPMSKIHFHSTSLPGSPDMLSKFEKLRVLSASVQFARRSVTPSLISCFHNIKIK